MTRRRSAVARGEDTVAANSLLLPPFADAVLRSHTSLQIYLACWDPGEAREPSREPAPNRDGATEESVDLGTPEEPASAASQRIVLVPLETAATLFSLRCAGIPGRWLRFVLQPAGSTSDTLIAVHVPVGACILHESAHIPEVVSDCSLPAAVDTSAEVTYCVAGVCAVVRGAIQCRDQLVWPGAPHYWRRDAGLLGFRRGSLAPPADFSLWTRFCQCDIPVAIGRCLAEARGKISQLPVEISRLEHHLRQPPRVHNVWKQERRVAAETPGARMPSGWRRSDHVTYLCHDYAEGHVLTIADLLLYPCVKQLQWSLALDGVDLSQALPAVTAWLERLETDRVLNLVRHTLFFHEEKNHELSSANPNSLQTDSGVNGTVKSSPVPLATPGEGCGPCGLLGPQTGLAWGIVADSSRSQRLKEEAATTTKSGSVGGTVKSGSVVDGTVESESVDGTVKSVSDVVGTVKSGSDVGGTVKSVSVDCTVKSGSDVDGAVKSGSVNGTVKSGSDFNGTVKSGFYVDGTVKSGSDVDGAVKSGSVDGTVKSGSDVNGTVKSGFYVDGTVKSGSDVDGAVKSGFGTDISATMSLYRRDRESSGCRRSTAPFYTNSELCLAESLLQSVCRPLAPYPGSAELDWARVPAWADPAAGQLPPSRLQRKRQQLASVVQVLSQVSGPSQRLVDFCGGGGHVALLAAALLPGRRVALVENKEQSARRALHRARQIPPSSSSTSRLEVFQCDMAAFSGPFHVGVALHACGTATDLVLARCLHARAAFVLCPCCYGAVRGDYCAATYPRSAAARAAGVSERLWLTAAHAADSTHADGGEKSRRGKRCMQLVDSDRLRLAEECGYRTLLTRCEPASCSDKNHLLVGVPPGWPYMSIFSQS